MKLRSKVVEIDAMLYTGNNVGSIWHKYGVEGIRDAGDHIVLTTLHGDEVPCRPGYWVVCEPVAHRFYPCDPEVIERKYEVIDD